jgi:hypothetical protein
MVVRAAISTNGGTPSTRAEQDKKQIDDYFGR